MSRGADEVDAGELPRGRIREAGAGRKHSAEVDPGLVSALLALIGPDAGRSGIAVALDDEIEAKACGELSAAGHRRSAYTAADLLRAQGFSVQGNAKMLEGRQHPDRDAQFRFINDRVMDHQAAGQPNRQALTVAVMPAMFR